MARADRDLPLNGMEGENNGPQSPQYAAPLAEPPGISWRTYLVISIACFFFLLLSVVAFFLWPWPEPEIALLFPETPREESIGSELYERSVNPLSGAFADTGAQVVNPLDDAYKNPFQ